jgi:CO/xanthine dehydrogenase FAD-binding subunit
VVFGAGGPVEGLFVYERASDASAAVALLAQAPSGAFLGGGTNLVDLMKLGVATPDLLVDVARLPYDPHRAPARRRPAHWRRGAQQ